MKVKTIKKYPSLQSEPMVLREVATLPGIGSVISIRAAKAHLSALLDLVASGQEITITSDGKPKAKLVKAETRERGKIFRGMGDYLMKQPIHRGMSAEEAVNLDRDARGW
jgi:prevent-host-death family protein